MIARPDGMPVAGPDVRWIGRRHGRRAGRGWAKSWSPEQITSRLRVDFPDDESMRISHEAGRIPLVVANPEWKGSRCRVGVEQGSRREEASVLRADPARSEWSGRIVGGRRVAELRVMCFIDAGRVHFMEAPISPATCRKMIRIEIADGLARGEPVKQIAARIGKSYRSMYREIARNRKPYGRYQPWFVHNRAYERRRRCRPRRFALDTELRELVASKLGTHWSPGQISRWLRRRHRRRPDSHVCSETIYQAVYRRLIVSVSTQNLRTGRTYRVQAVHP
jgi:Helix-turn-helix domain